MFFSSSPQPLVNGAHLCEELTRFLSENKSDFEQKLIPDLSHIDHMAHNVNGIEIKNISFVVDNQYQLDYSMMTASSKLISQNMKSVILARNFSTNKLFKRDSQRVAFSLCVGFSV